MHNFHFVFSLEDFLYLGETRFNLFVLFFLLFKVLCYESYRSKP